MDAVQTVVEPRLAEIKAEIGQHLKRQWEDVLAIGRLATEAKGLIPYGGFTQWIMDEVGLSPRLIQGYMRIYDRFDSRKLFASLPISALLMLASPSVSDGVVMEISGRIDQGERFSIEAMEAVIDRYRVLEGAQIGSRALLQNYGTHPDGTMAKAIPRSALTSLADVATDGLQRGAVTIEGMDVPVTLSLPPAILAAVEAETKRRQADHVDDSPPKLRTRAVICQLPTDPMTRGYVMLRLADLNMVDHLAEGQSVTLVVDTKE